MSHRMGKPTICIGENKGANELSFAVTAKLISAFVFTTWIVQLPSTLSQNFKPLACFCDCTGRFVSHLVGNPKDRFSRVMAHMKHDIV